MKYLINLIAIILSSSTFAKMYDVSAGDKVSIVYSLVDVLEDANKEEIHKNSSVELDKKCQKLDGDLIGSQKYHLIRRYRDINTDIWHELLLVLQVCKEPNGLSGINENSDRIVLMTEEYDQGGKNNARKEMKGALLNRCSDIDGQLLGEMKLHRGMSDIRIGHRDRLYEIIHWIGAQVCKY